MTNDEMMKDFERHLEVVKNEKPKNWFSKKIIQWTIKNLEKTILELKNKTK